MNSGFDSSLRDLRENWLPLTSLVFVLVALTTVAVALVARWLVPEMTWAVALTLGAAVSRRMPLRQPQFSAKFDFHIG